MVNRELRSLCTALVHSTAGRDFLEMVADEARLFGREDDRGEYNRGRLDALRQLVSLVVLHAAVGAEWMKWYTERKVAEKAAIDRKGK